MKSSEEVVVLLAAAHSRRMSLLVGFAADRVSHYFSLFLLDVVCCLSFFLMW
jgi:hypothetical protein